MKIDKEMLYRSIEQCAIDKIYNDLVKQGFEVEKEKQIITDNQKGRIELDLFATKGEDRRVYEFRMGTYGIRKEQYECLQRITKELSARLYIVYVEKPQSDVIEFEGLKDILLTEVKMMKQVPISTDSVTDVTVLNVSRMKIAKKCVMVEGNAIAYCAESNEQVEHDFYFKLTYNISTEKVESANYKFDGLFCLE